MKFLEFMAKFLTDANNEPEIKAILGVVTIVISFVWLFVKSDVQGFLLIFAAGGGLLLGKTVEDLKINAINKGTGQ